MAVLDHPQDHLARTPTEPQPAPEATKPAVRAMESWSTHLDLLHLAERYGTPLYVHHPATLWESFQAYVRLVGDPGNVRYPVKANPSPLVLNALARWGGGADCASRPEVRAALAAGIPVERVSYNTPAMDLRLAAWLLRQGGTVVVDSESVLAELEQIADREPPAGHLFVRVNPGGLPGYRKRTEVQKYTAHGEASSQFGIASERLPELLRGTSVMISGLHVHVGTMMDNLDTFVAGLEFLHALVDVVLADTPHPLSALNLGGGLGLPHYPEQEFPTIDALTEALRPHLRDDLRYEVEPGNSLVGDSFGLVTRVVSLKESRGRRWGLCDVGTDQLVKHTVARWEHQIVDASGHQLPTEGPDALGGPLCFAGDVLLPNTDLGRVAQGDPLLVRHAGAYCEAIASHFNGRLSPATVVVDEDGGSHLVRRREDPFYAAELQTYRPEGFRRDADSGRRVAEERIESLQSEYMHHLAEDEGYEIGEVREVAQRTYVFQVTPRAPVGFVALPLALRIVGDASITAVGLELGWEKKEAPVWCTNLTMSAGANLPGDRPLPCRVAVSALTPGSRPGTAAVGHVHFELGENAEFKGAAKVSVPASD